MAHNTKEAPVFFLSANETAEFPAVVDGRESEKPRKRSSRTLKFFYCTERVGERWRGT